MNDDAAIFIALLGAVGLTTIITDSGLFAWLRARGPAMLGCPQCLGMWIGALVGGIGSAVLVHGRGAWWTLLAIPAALLFGGATSLVAYVLGIWLTQLATTTHLASEAIQAQEPPEETRHPPLVAAPPCGGCGAPPPVPQRKA